VSALLSQDSRALTAGWDYPPFSGAPCPEDNHINHITRNISPLRRVTYYKKGSISMAFPATEGYQLFVTGYPNN